MATMTLLTAATKPTTVSCSVAFTTFPRNPDYKPLRKPVLTPVSISLLEFLPVCFTIRVLSLHPSPYICPYKPNFYFMFHSLSI